MTEDRVIEVARDVASAQGWPWLEPVRVRRRRRWFRSPLWEVVSNSDALGMNVRIVVDDTTGRVLEKGFLPR
jgi:hypothetical protein